MLGLLDQMEAENPEDPALAPKAGFKRFELRLCHMPSQIFDLTQLANFADLQGMGQCICQVCASLQKAGAGLRSSSSSPKKERHERSTGGLHGASAGSQGLAGACCAMQLD